MFYLEDDTMQVVEPREENTGLTHGPPWFYLLILYLSLSGMPIKSVASPRSASRVSCKRGTARSCC